MPALSFTTRTHPPSAFSGPTPIDHLARHWGLALAHWVDARASRFAERRAECGREHYRHALVEAEADRARADARAFESARLVR